MASMQKGKDLVDALRTVRQRIDETLRDKGDPVKTLVSLAPLVERADGSIGDLRVLAPGLGDLWDTLRASIRLATAIADQIAAEGGGPEDEGLHATAGATPDLDRGLSGGTADLGEDWDPARPDD